MERKFAILCWTLNNNIQNIVAKLPENSKITVFVKHGILPIALTNVDSCYLDEKYDTVPKARNFILQYYKNNELHMNNTSYLHILEDNVDILKDPLQFIDDIEYMMSLLDLNSWFNTINDPCNYVYSKYNPRLNIALDDDKYSLLKIKNLLFTSHANTTWTIFDMTKQNLNDCMLSEDYTIPMFYIIEYLATRRNNKAKGEIKYMNQYPTVQSEYKVFSTLHFENASDNAESNMQKEDQIFKDKNINFLPDNNIDLILEDVYAKLNEKVK